MNWQQVIEDPSLKDLPYKIELKEWGNIILSPVSNKHAYYQGCTNDYISKWKKKKSSYGVKLEFI